MLGKVSVTSFVPSCRPSVCRDLVITVSDVPTFFRVFVYADHHFTEPYAVFYLIDHPDGHLEYSPVPLVNVDDILEVVPGTEPDSFITYEPESTAEQIRRTISRIRATNYRSA